MGARQRVGAYMYVSALSAEIVDGTLPVKRFTPRSLRRAPTCSSPRASRLEDRTGGAAAYRWASRVSAEMLARIGPVKPFLNKYLIAHSEACGRTERTAHAQPHARGEACAASGGARPCEGAHSFVSAVSAEIVVGTVPTRRG